MPTAERQFSTVFGYRQGVAAQVFAMPVRSVMLLCDSVRTCVNVRTPGSVDPLATAPEPGVVTVGVWPESFARRRCHSPWIRTCRTKAPGPVRPAGTPDRPQKRPPPRSRETARAQSRTAATSRARIPPSSQIRSTAPVTATAPTGIRRRSWMGAATEATPSQVSSRSAAQPRARVMSRTPSKPDGSVTVSVDVKNTGTRAGDQVVQLYLHQQIASVTRPVKELKGFQRVTLAPGEQKTLTFTVGSEALRMYNQAMRRVVEPGAFDIMVGPNSQDLKTAVLTVAG